MTRCVVMMRQAKCSADRQIALLSESVSRLEQQLKTAECERATLQDQVPRLQDQIACLQRKLAAADSVQRKLDEVICSCQLALSKV